MAQPFVVPEGVVFNIDDDGVAIENRGDIVLHTTFGRPLKRVVSAEGNIEIHAPVAGGAVRAAGNVTLASTASVERIEAGGHLSVGGDCKADALEAAGNASIGGSLHAIHARAGGTLSVGGKVSGGTFRGDVVELRGSTIQARGIQGQRRVEVGDAVLTVDAIVAPEVAVSAATRGRVTVVESANELGSNALKGCFRLADYGEISGGDPAAFLAERGLAPLGAAAPPPGPSAAPAPTAEPARVVTSAAPVGAPAPARVTMPPPPPPEPVDPFADLVVRDETDSDAPTGHPSAAGDSGTHPLHAQLAETVGKIVEAYAPADRPPAVDRLATMVQERRYESVRAEITNIWSELLKFHQKKGLRIQHQVTTTFNQVNSLVKKM